jgi:hypothetical protein
VSDKSRKSVSPRHTPNIMPNALAESGRQASMSSRLAQLDKVVGHQDPHGAKVARLDTGTSPGYGTETTDIPPKIEEGIEPG